MGIGAKTVQHTIAPTLHTQPGIYNMTPVMENPAHPSTRDFVAFG